jgi:hypothetical protein
MLRGSLSKHNTSGCFSPSRGTPDRLPVDGATTRRRNDGGAAWLGLGFGRRGVQAARVHGWDSGCGGCLNRTGFSACGPGGGGVTRAWEAGSGSGSAPVRFRPEVEDDGRGSPVGDCGRSAAEVGRNWAKTASGLRAARGAEAAGGGS